MSRFRLSRTLPAAALIASFCSAAPAAADLFDIGPLQVVAGGGSGEGGPALDASVLPLDVLSANGLLYIADERFNLVRAVAADGAIATVAGNGDFGFDGDGRVLVSHDGGLLEVPPGAGSRRFAEFASSRFATAVVDGPSGRGLVVGTPADFGDANPLTLIAFDPEGPPLYLPLPLALAGADALAANGAGQLFVHHPGGQVLAVRGIAEPDTTGAAGSRRSSSLRSFHPARRSCRRTGRGSCSPPTARRGSCGSSRISTGTAPSPARKSGSSSPFCRSGRQPSTSAERRCSPRPRPAASTASGTEPSRG